MAKYGKYYTIVRTWLKHGMDWKMNSQTDWKELAWNALLAIEIHCIVNIRPEANLWTLFQADIKPCDYRSTETKFIFCLIKSALLFRTCKQDKIQALHCWDAIYLGFVVCLIAATADLQFYRWQLGFVVAPYVVAWQGTGYYKCTESVLFGLFKVVNSINWQLNRCYRCSHMLQALTHVTGAHQRTGAW